MGFEPHDLQVMSLASYRTALPRAKKHHHYTPFIVGCQASFLIIFLLKQKKCLHYQNKKIRLPIVES